MLGACYRVENPFLDLDVIEAFLALPLAHRSGQQAYRRMLARTSPRLANICENKTRRPVAHADKRGVSALKSKPRVGSMNLPNGMEWRLNAIRRAYGNLLVNVSKGWLGPHDRTQYAHHAANIREVDPTWFRYRLLEAPNAHEWFDVRALDRLYSEHLAGRRDHSTRINNVIAFLHWLPKLTRTDGDGAADTTRDHFAAGTGLPVPGT
jgi:hypothetical protein